MRIAIHQPNFIPWLGYFQKIKSSDLFVLFDTVEYTKNGFINRNKVRIRGEEHWLTIPVRYKGFSKTPISEIQIDPAFRPDKMLATLVQEFKFLPYFHKYFPQFEVILKNATIHRNLADLNEELIRWITEILQIKTQIIRASALLPAPPSEATEKIIDLCKNCAADIYLSGQSGKKYLKEELFEKNRIGLEYLDTRIITDKFDNLSVLYWLFKNGPDLL